MTAVLTAETLDQLIGPRDAVDAIRRVLLDGLDPDQLPPRTVVHLAHGQALLMAAEVGAWFGVKVATIAPDNPATGRPRIQGSYLLHDSATLTPVAALDAVWLTNTRTAAVSFAPLVERLTGRAPLNIVVFGRGPQAVAHIATVRALAEVASVTTVGRDDDREAVADADVVICATTARVPLFEHELVRPDALVIAVGSHEAEARELSAALLGRATVVVESRDVATREAGDVIRAVAEGALDPAALVPMAAAVRDPGLLAPDRPVVVKTCGMAWEDLAVAAAAFERLGRKRP